MQARGLLTGSTWKGGPIVSLKDNVHWQTTEADVTTNATPFGRETARCYGDRVPSAFFFTDVFFSLHHNLHERLLIPKSADETVQSIAGGEGGKMKKLHAHLRAMWRDKPNTAKSPAKSPASRVSAKSR